MIGGGERMARMKQKETKGERSADYRCPTLQALPPYLFLQIMVKE